MILLPLPHARHCNLHCGYSGEQEGPGHVTHEACQPVALSWEGRIAVWFSLFFFNLISEIATFNTFVIRKCYYLKISTVFKIHIVLYLCSDGLKNTQNLNDATMFNKSKAPD